ncbi:MAG: bacteriohemerythrin [Actinomycetota bacterium]
MDKVQWSDDLLLQVDAIDNDHKKLFALINEIFATAHHGPAAINDAIGALWTYTKEHFAREQDSMRRANYPGMDAHAYEHEHLIFQLETLTNRLMDAGPEAIDDGLATFLEEWLTGHILKFDRAYADYLRESGQHG